MSASPKAGCHAVLASLSGRYPPLEGRSPTCYSPVCHSSGDCSPLAFDLHVLGTPPALILSQDQTLKLMWSTTTLSGRRQNRLNAERLLIWLLSRCSVRQVMG